MRSLSFVNLIDLPGLKVNSSSKICLYDIDADQDDELVIGHNLSTNNLTLDNPSSDYLSAVSVIKYGRIWKQYKCCSLITAVSAGNIVSGSRPYIVAASADSLCYIFDATNSEGSELSLFNKQNIPANVKDICVISGSGTCEIAFAHSDRVVRLYRWNHQKDQGFLELVTKWELSAQISRISCHYQNNENHILVSQPGGGYALLTRRFLVNEKKCAPALVYYPPCPENTLNPDMRTWIMGDVKRDISPESLSNDNRSSYFAICIADGTILLTEDPLEEKSNEKYFWCAQLNSRGEMFGLSKTQITNQPNEDLCVCAWDGSLYIINHKREILHFSIGQPCQAFLAGKYAIKPGKNEPVLIFATMTGHVLIHYDLNVDQIPPKSVLHDIINDESLLRKFEEKGVDTNNRTKLQKAINYLLYEYPKLNPVFSLPK